MRHAGKVVARRGPCPRAAVENPRVRVSEHCEQPYSPRSPLAGFVVENYYRLFACDAACAEERREDRKECFQGRFGRIVEADAVKVEMPAAFDRAEREIFRRTQVEEGDRAQAFVQLGDRGQVAPVGEIFNIHFRRLALALAKK